MIILDTTTRSLEVDLNAVVTTNQLPFVASYVDINQSTFAMSAMSTNTGASNSTTAVTLVAAPGATTSRQLKYLSIKNSDTVATTLWVQYNDNATLREIWKGTLAVNDTLVYVDSLGWNVLDTNGRIKDSAGVQGPGVTTDNALVRWDGTGGTNIQNSGWTLDDSNVLTTGSHIALGANSISRAGTAAGFSLDASNNATFSANLTVSGATITTGSTTALSLATNGGTRATFADASRVGFGTTVMPSTTSFHHLFMATDTGYDEGVIAASAGDTVYGQGYYYASGWKYGTSAYQPLAIRLTAGNFGFLTAATGTADAALTWAEQARITHTASATNYLTLTGGTNPTIGVSGGNLAITPITVFGAQARLKGYTVATLPAGTQGDCAYVTDALAPAFLGTLVGSGAVVTPAFYDGTNWVAM